MDTESIPAVKMQEGLKHLTHDIREEFISLRKSCQRLNLHRKCESEIKPLRICWIFQDVLSLVHLIVLLLFIDHRLFIEIFVFFWSHAMLIVQGIGTPALYVSLGKRNSVLQLQRKKRATWTPTASISRIILQVNIDWILTRTSWLPDTCKD